MENVDQVFQQALDAGAKQEQALEDRFYGDRSGGVSDDNGNHWYIATHVEDVSQQELERRLAAMAA